MAAPFHLDDLAFFGKRVFRRVMRSGKRPYEGLDEIESQRCRPVYWAVPVSNPFLVFTCAVTDRLIVPLLPKARGVDCNVQGRTYGYIKDVAKLIGDEVGLPRDIVFPHGSYKRDTVCTDVFNSFVNSLRDQPGTNYDLATTLYRQAMELYASRLRYVWLDARFNPDLASITSGQWEAIVCRREVLTRNKRLTMAPLAYIRDAKSFDFQRCVDLALLAHQTTNSGRSTVIRTHDGRSINSSLFQVLHTRDGFDRMALVQVSMRKAADALAKMPQVLVHDLPPLFHRDIAKLVKPQPFDEMASCGRVGLLLKRGLTPMQLELTSDMFPAGFVRIYSDEIDETSPVYTQGMTTLVVFPANALAPVNMHQLCGLLEWTSRRVILIGSVHLEPPQGSGSFYRDLLLSKLPNTKTAVHDQLPFHSATPNMAAWEQYLGHREAEAFSFDLNSKTLPYDRTASVVRQKDVVITRGMPKSEAAMTLWRCHGPVRCLSAAKPVLPDDHFDGPYCLATDSIFSYDALRATRKAEASPTTKDGKPKRGKKAAGGKKKTSAAAPAAAPHKKQFLPDTLPDDIDD